MPETSGEVEIYVELTAEDIQKLQYLMESGMVGEQEKLSCGCATRGKNEIVTIETEQEVTLEFDLGDYAPCRNEGYD